MTNTAPIADAVSWQRLSRVTGMAGLAAVVLIFVVLVSTREEPSFAATADEFLTHYQAPNTVASDFRSFAFTVALVTFVWFVVALTTLLRQAEGEAPWRSNIAMASGVLFVALVLSGNEVAAAFRADDLDPQIARYAFDEGQAAFANARVALGSFAVCAAGSSRRPDFCRAGWDGWPSRAEWGLHSAASAGLATSGCRST